MKNEQKYKTPSKHETIADILAYMRECADGTEKHGLYDLRECGTDYLRALADLIEAAAKREVAELRECLVRRSSHLNAILQTALELRNGVPPELRKVMDECIVEEDKAVGLGVFSKKGAKDETK